MVNFEHAFTNAEACSEPCQASKMERFAKIVNGDKPLTIFARLCILDVCQSSEYASVAGQFPTMFPPNKKSITLLC